ncbi:hypothetical protein HID58_082851, partial [Brassica napus]
MATTAKVENDELRRFKDVNLDEASARQLIQDNQFLMLLSLELWFVSAMLESLPAMVGGVWSEDMSLQLEATTLLREWDQIELIRNRAVWALGNVAGDSPRGSIERFITEWSSGSISCLLFHRPIMLVVSWTEWSSGKKVYSSSSLGFCR